MARRASSGASSSQIVLIIAAVTILAGAAWFFMNRTPSASDSPSLPIQSFLDDANSMYGSTYAVEGEINEKFPPATGGDVLLSLKVDNNGQNAFIPIRIPAANTFGNLTVRQSYSFEVTIGEGGLPTAVEVVAL